MPKPVGMTTWSARRPLPHRRPSDGAVGWGPPSAELAAMVLGLGGSHPGPAPWAIGLDLGKVHDPTAIVVMRRVSVDRPELPPRRFPMRSRSPSRRSSSASTSG
jgi:hypothetical protein